MPADAMDWLLLWSAISILALAFAAGYFARAVSAPRCKPELSNDIPHGMANLRLTVTTGGERFHYNPDCSAVQRQKTRQVTECKLCAAHQSRGKNNSR